MLTNTQALKDKLQTLGKGGESFSQVRMGVGQEFVSVVKIVGQEKVSEVITERTMRKEWPTEQRVRNNPSKT